MNRKLHKGIFWGLVFSIPVWALLLTLILSVGALADFTVGKTMYEPFQMFNADGTARTNCDLAKFTTRTWQNDSPVSLTWTFRDFSTGVYSATAIPATVGNYVLAIFYNNTAVGTYTDDVRLWDIDTMYGSAGPRLANISGNLVGSATAFVAVRNEEDNITSLVRTTNTKVSAIPTTPLLANDTRLNNLNAPISGIPTNPLLANDTRLNNLDAAVSTRMAAGDWTAELPEFSEMTSLSYRNGKAIAAIPPDINYGPQFANLSSASQRNAASIAAIPNYGTRFSNNSTAIARGLSAVPMNVWGAATRTLTASFSNPTSINNFLAAQHGAGTWGASFSVLPFQGTVSYETVSQGKDIHVTSGDSVSIPYSTGSDLTGWTVWFGAKATPEDDTYAILPRDITAYVTNPSTGSGLISLSTADTDLPVRKYSAEVKIKNGTNVNTVLKFTLFIDASVIN
ncbi:MAG: hypothetical protein ACYDFU_09480 [Nitrospirota bacterium]